MAIYGDSTGKYKGVDSRQRATLSLTLILGICLGIVVSERMYIRSEEAKIGAATIETLRSQKLETVVASNSLRSGGVSTTTASAAGSQLSLSSKSRKPRNDLEKTLQRVAPDGEVMIVISNYNLIREGSLKLWLECAQEISIRNWMVVAIDEDLRDYCEENSINHYYRPVKIPATQVGTGDNHAISAMKYEIVEEFLTLGWNVLLSDVDIVIVQDPLLNLYRDSDVEGMSDGFDDGTAYGMIYGVDDPGMGWSRYAQGIQHMVLNSGLFYLRANSRTIELMQRIAARLRREKAWDQSVYNEEIFFLSHGTYKSPQVSVRVMEREKFMNSKTLFKFVRHQPVAAQPRPVMVHMNYHPDKLARMKAAVQYYLKGKADALDAFPGGSEPGS